MKSAGSKTDLERLRSRPARGGWIEIAVISRNAVEGMSRPARGGWIEIA